MPVWVSKDVVLALHEEQLAEHGGGTGIRDEGLLESALARPENLVAYGGNPDLADLAAAYAFGLARNHAFVDGNKRTSMVTTETFLVLNGYEMDVSNALVVVVWEDLAAGTMSEPDMAAWIRARMSPLP